MSHFITNILFICRYWALWPERPEENRHWEHYVLYFKNRQSETSSSSSLSFASPRPKITDSSIIGGSSGSSGSAIGGSSSSSGSSGVRSASISNLVTSEKASSSSSAALSGISASQPSAGRITERVSTTTKTESGVTSGLNKAAKTTSAESLDAQPKKVHFAEEQPQQQQQQQRPPATPSFGVRLSFNTEKLIGGGGVGAGSGTPTLSQPKSLMTASMPNVADITATILTSEVGLFAVSPNCFGSFFSLIYSICHWSVGLLSDQSFSLFFSFVSQLMSLCQVTSPSKSARACLPD